MEEERVRQLFFDNVHLVTARVDPIQTAATAASVETAAASEAETIAMMADASPSSVSHTVFCRQSPKGIMHK